jgi:hypothetical protein
MNRRQIMMLPGVALAAHQASAQVVRPSGARSRTASRRVSHKILLKYDRPKAVSKIPKTEAKVAKYLYSLNALLALNSTQQQQAASIFTTAAAILAGLRSNAKIARQSLATAVKNNDTAGIGQLSITLGNLHAQQIADGSNANAAFFQILTADQQSKLTLFQS